VVLMSRTSAPSDSPRERAAKRCDYGITGGGAITKKGAGRVALRGTPTGALVFLGPVLGRGGIFDAFEYFRASRSTCGDERFLRKGRRVELGHSPAHANDKLSPQNSAGRAGRSAWDSLPPRAWTAAHLPAGAAHAFLRSRHRERGKCGPPDGTLAELASLVRERETGR